MRAIPVLLILSIIASACTGTTAADICAPTGPVVSLPTLHEASGVAFGRGDQILFAINDSSTPSVTLLDRQGRRLRDVHISGATITDWEDVTVARCAAGHCLYIADIGDNDRARDRVRLYRVPEPSRNAAATAPADAIELQYPDGSHDAEAVFATADGQIYLVTKEADGADLYRVPEPLRTGGPHTLTRVGRIEVSGIDEHRITDADASADGTWVALRGNHEAFFYRTADLLSGRTGDPLVVSLRSLGEPQGEGIAFGEPGMVYLVGEGGGDGRPGTFASLRCTLPGR